ncbi:MAG: rhomboid family intramembrane serine protease [Nonlabens sp.]
MSFIDDLEVKYDTLDVSGKLIAIIGVFTIATWILGLVYRPLYLQFALPSGFIPALLQPWSYITHAFMHGGIFHFIGNAIGLHLAGRFMLNIFNKRQYLTLFFIGVLAGGFSYTLATSLMDYYFNPGIAIGASAGVFALIIFCCVYFAESEIRIIFFNVKLKYVGYTFLAFNLVGLFTRFEAGSSLAHLAGMGIGLWSALRMKDGVDVLEGFARTGDYFTGLFKKSDGSKSRSQRKPRAKMKTVYKNKDKRAAAATSNHAASPSQKEIDLILDKISASGYESLSKAEKDTLFNVGKK